MNDQQISEKARELVSRIDALMPLPSKTRGRHWLDPEMTSSLMVVDAEVDLSDLNLGDIDLEDVDCPLTQTVSVELDTESFPRLPVDFRLLCAIDDAIALLRKISGGAK